MKAFHFSLQAVQTIRQQQEQKALEDYARAIRSRRLAEEALQGIMVELVEVWNVMRNGISRCIDAMELTKAHDYRRLLEDRRQQRERDVQASEDRVRQAWLNLVSARQKRKIIEKLHQTLHLRYQREANRREQLQADELANRRGRLTTAWKSKPQLFDN